MDTQNIVERIAAENGLTAVELLERTQTPKRKNAIKQLYAALKEAGLTIRQIAELTGRDESTVVRVFRDYKRELQLREGNQP